MKVCKFGGSSLADATQFRKVKSIVERDDQRRYVVVSAPGKRFDGDQKVTDMLYAFHGLVKRGEDSDALWGAIGARFSGIRDELKLKTDIEALLAAIREEVLSGAGEDYTVSRGEFLSGVLMADF
jgi:Aspartokinases